jgi:hypothetical protein
MAQGSSRSPRKHSLEAEDPEPDFDISPDLLKLKSHLCWADARGRTAMVGLSRPMHALLHQYDPNRIGPTPGPYSHALVADVVSSYVVHHRQVLTNPAFRGYCIATGIPEFRLLVGKDRFLFNELASLVRKHMVLLDIVDAVP